MFPGIQGIHPVIGASASGGFGSIVGNTLTVASGTVSANINNYPVYVNMANLTSGFWANIASDGSNLRIRQGGSDIPFDLVNFNYAGSSGTLFFKANLLTASNNVFTVEIVAGATAPAVGDPLGRNAVWSAFQRVVHGWEQADRTGSGAAFTMGGTAAFSGGVLSTPNNSYAYLPAGSPQTSYSMFFYGFVGGLNITNSSFMSFSDTWSASPNRQTLTFRSTVETIAVWNNTNGFLENPAASHDPITFTAGMSTQSGVARTLFVDGSQVATSGSAANIPSGANPVLILGMEDSDLTEDFRGDVYLACLAPSVLPPAWFAAMNTNLRTPTSFYTVT